jgi:hypothetical protein
MQSIIFSLALILLARYGSASTPPNRESRFGVLFSPSTIIASRFNASGSIELTKFPASSAYQQYYREAVQNSDLDHDIDEINAKSIFRNSIQPITETLSKQLGHAPEYASLFVPSIFDYRTRLAAREVIFQKPQYATRAAPSQIAACWPYSFLQGKNLGRPAHECNDDGPDNIIFLLEYEEEYIYAWLLLVEYELGGYPVTQEKICKECGEQHREVRFFGSSIRTKELVTNIAHRNSANELTKNESSSLCMTSSQRMSRYISAKRFEPLLLLAKRQKPPLLNLATWL